MILLTKIHLEDLKIGYQSKINKLMHLNLNFFFRLEEHCPKSLGIIALEKY